MMKKIFTFFLLLLLNNICWAQTPNWLWAQGTGLAGFQYGIGVAASNSGDIYVGGRLTNGTSTFMGGVTVTCSGTQPFHGRFQPNGNFVWAQAINNGSFVYEQALYKDAADNTYSTGVIQGGGSGLYVARYNSMGTQTLYVNNTTPGNLEGKAIVADSKGNIYAAGKLNGTTTFGSTTITSAGGDDIFLVKYNSTGVVQWAKRIGSTGTEAVNGMAVDDSDNLFFSGGYNSGASFNFGTIAVPAAAGYGNYFIAKYDPQGNAMWVKTVGSAGQIGAGDPHDAIVADPFGNLYVTGWFQGTAQFGSQSITSLGGYDAFVAKISARTGAWIWVNSGGGTSGRDGGTAIALDRDYDVYVTGEFQSPTFTFGSTTITNASGGTEDVFVVKFANSTGSVVWAKTGGGTHDDNPYGITVDNQKFVYITGDFAQSTIFGTTTLTTGSGDLFIAKLDTVVDRKIIPVLSSYCIGTPQPLPYIIKGPFTAGNTFTAQLSDNTGSFASPITIGNVTATTNGIINITIPPGTPAGTHYKIRILSSSPVYSSLDTTNVTITGPCKPNILNGDSTILDTVYCFENINHEIMGVAHGGIFTGCGIVDSGGKWFFNPALAAGPTTNFPFRCPITYTLPNGTDSTQMMIVNRPEKVNAGNDTVTCTGQFVLNATPGELGNYNFAWIPATGLTDATKATTNGAITSNNQTYRIDLVNAATGCKAFDSVTVFYDHFAAVIVTDRDTICALNGITVSAMITPETLVSYQWDMGDGTTSAQRVVQHNYTTTGNYTITLVAKDAYCPTSATRAINVQDFHVALTAGDTLVEQGSTVTLATNADVPYRVTQWRPAELFNDQTALSQTFIPKISGQEYVIVAESERYGCVDSARIGVRLNSNVYMPDAFTPNGDGRNDYFRPINIGSGEPFRVNSFKIYNRWGEAIFTAANATALKGWDGTYNGQPAEIGTYFYTIEIQKYSGAVIDSKGDVTLIR